MKPIVHVPNPVLTGRSSPVTTFDKRLLGIIGELKTTLVAAKNPKGVGLAAPQIGEPSRVFVTKPREKSPIRVFINPEITQISEELTDGVPERENKLEGCLSIPRVWGKVKRAARITLRFQDEEGHQHEKSFEGFEATIVQHETDHVNGILYTQRVLEQKGKLYKATTDQEGKEILEEISLP